MKNKILIIVLFVLGIGAIAAGFLMDGKGNKKVEKVTSIIKNEPKIGETLEATGSGYKLKVKALSKPTMLVIPEGRYKDITMGRIKVEIENSDNKDLNVNDYVLFKLADKMKKDIAIEIPTFSGNGSIQNAILAPGEKKEGYVYLGDEIADKYNNEYIAKETINNAVYLKVSLIKHIYREQNRVTYYDYYINLEQ